MKLASEMTPEEIKKVVEEIQKAVNEMHEDAAREDMSMYNYSYFD